MDTTNIIILFHDINKQVESLLSESYDASMLTLRTAIQLSEQ